jgi:hypothetical protein
VWQCCVILPTQGISETEYQPAVNRVSKNNNTLPYFTEWLRWSNGWHAGLWYPSSWVQTQPKPSDFLGEKILSMPSFGGEVKLSVPCCSFAACKKPLQFPWKSHCRLNLISHFSPIIPPFADRGLSHRLIWSASGDDREN